MSEPSFDNRIDDEIRVSPAALEQLIGIMEQEQDMAGIRVYVAGGGCGGMSYGMTMVEQPTQFDLVREYDGLNIFVDSVALGFLEGVEIDFRDDGMNKSFVFKNVFANTGGSGTCGTCGAAGGGCG